MAENIWCWRQLAERAKAFREAGTLRRLGGPEKIRQQRATVLAEKVKTRQKTPNVLAAERIQRAFKKYQIYHLKNANFIET